MPPAQPDWNEWGYLDYGLIDDHIRSLNCLMQDLTNAGPFDLIYSVSVIEPTVWLTRAPSSVRAENSDCAPWLTAKGPPSEEVSTYPGRK